MNFMLVHGAISGQFGWTTGSAPTTILTSGLTLLLGLIAGLVIGCGAGVFAASLVVAEPLPNAASAAGVASPATARAEYPSE